MKSTQKFMQQNTWGKEIVKSRQPHTTPAGLWVDTPSVVGERGHKRAECALNNHNKSPSSPS